MSQQVGWKYAKIFEGVEKPKEWETEQEQQLACVQQYHHDLRNNQVQQKEEKQKMKDWEWRKERWSHGKQHPLK